MTSASVQTSTLPKQGFAQKIFLRVANWIKAEYRLTHYAHTRWKAEKGDPAAQYNLGLLCEAGHGVFQTAGEAVKWFQKAAFQGVAGAQLALGLKYLRGQGLTQNDAEALLWLRKAAEQGLPEAQFEVANLYRDGRGAARDLLQAAKWYRKAADRGHAVAKQNFKEVSSSNLGPVQVVAPAPNLERQAA